MRLKGLLHGAISLILLVLTSQVAAKDIAGLLLLDNMGQPNVFFGGIGIFHAVLGGAKTSPMFIAPGKALAGGSDGSGKFHLIALNGTELQYLTNQSGRWVVQQIEPIDAGKYSSVAGAAIDAYGVMHVVFVAGDDLVYANNEGQSWRTEIVSKHCCDLNSNPSILLSGTHPDITIIYYDQENHTLTQTVGIDGHWTENFIYQGKLQSFSTSMNASGTMYIMATDGTRVFYISQQEDSWVNQALPLVPTPSEVISVTSAITADEQLHLVVAADTGLLYMRKINDSWLTQVVETEGGYVTTSVVIDNQGAAYVCYAQAVSTALHCSSNRTGYWEKITTPTIANLTQSSAAPESFMAVQVQATIPDPFRITSNLENGSFGEVLIGESKVSVFNIENIFTSRLTVYVIHLLNENEGQYSLDLGTCTKNTSLEPGDSCSLSVSFSPKSVAIYSFGLLIENSYSAGSVHILQFEGVGVNQLSTPKPPDPPNNGSPSSNPVSSTNSGGGGAVDLLLLATLLLSFSRWRFKPPLA